MIVPSKVPDAFPPGARHVVSVSGGKDSTCTYLLALHLLGPDGFTAVFADTGWEHEDTYRYVEELPAKAGGPPIRRAAMPPPTEERLETRRKGIAKHFHDKGIFDEETIEKARRSIRADPNPFKNLAMLRGGFPNSIMRFCTEHLKIRPMENQVLNPIRKSGVPVVSWQGTRAEESKARSLLPTTQQLDPSAEGMASMWAWRPILDWTLEDVRLWAEWNDVPLNPLYDKGFSRVGCYPCVFARQGEIDLIARLNPERIEEIAEWEEEVNKRIAANHGTFFKSSKYKKNGAGPYHYEEHGIHSIVEWAQRGSSMKRHREAAKAADISGKARAARMKAIRNADRLRKEMDAKKEEADSLEEVFSTACNQWGACE